MMHRKKMIPMTGELTLTTGRLALDQNLHICSNAPGDGAKLDGVVDQGDVITVPKDEATHSWMTGLNWVFRPNPDGTWAILNQGQNDHALSAGTGTVTLGRAGLESARWLIYRDPRHDHFMMRPIGLAWLCAGEDRPVLARTTETDPMASRWSLLPAGS